MRAARIPPGTVILQHTLHYYTAASASEAAFLVALLNAPSLHRAYVDSRTSGRHFTNNPWRAIPIPRYDATDSLHVRLSELGGTTEQECKALIVQSDIFSKPAGDAQSRSARQLLRHHWRLTSATARTIEAAVAELLSDPAQATLAEQQMIVGRDHPIRTIP